MRSMTNIAVGNSLRDKRCGNDIAGMAYDDLDPITVPVGQHPVHRRRSCRPPAAWPGFEP
jgi:hypothetical protein